MNTCCYCALQAQHSTASSGINTALNSVNEEDLSEDIVVLSEFGRLQDGVRAEFLHTAQPLVRILILLSAICTMIASFICALNDTERYQYVLHDFIAAVHDAFVLLLWQCLRYRMRLTRSYCSMTCTM
jgi:hypothetical protein